MRSYSHLSEDERDHIGVLRAAGRSMGAIARTLGRAKATISRELHRNALPSGRYSPLHAAGAYQLRRRRERRGLGPSVQLSTRPPYPTAEAMDPVAQRRRSMPPIFAAEPRSMLSRTAASDRSRWLWLTFFDRRANARSSAAE